MRGTDALESACRVTELVARARTVDDACGSVLSACRSLLAADRVAVLLLDERGRMRFRASDGLSAGYRAAVEGHSPWPLDASDPAPILVPDVGTDPALAGLRDVVLGEGIRALVFVPLVCDGALIGKFMVYFDAPRALAPGEVTLLRLLATQVAFAIARLGAERRAADRTAELQGVLEAVPEGVTVYGPDRRARYVNAAVVAGTPIRREQLVGRSVEDMLAGYEICDAEGRRVGVDDLPHATAYAGAATEGVFAFRRPGDPPVTRWLLVSGSPIRAADGTIASVVVTVRDVTAARREAQARQLLVDANALLASSLDYEATLASVARATVPRLADWCRVDLATEDGGVATVAVAHSDPARVELVWQFVRAYPEDPDARSGTAEVLRTGKPELWPEITDAMVVANARDEEHLRFTRALGLASVLIVPMRARGRVLGAITCASAESGHRFDEHDLAVAMRLADHAALAVDNARLYTEARASRERLEVALEAGRIGTWEYHAPSGRFEWSGALARLQGVPPEALAPTLEGYLATIHPDHRADARASLETVITNGGEHRREYRIVLPDGTVRWVEARARSELDAQGRPWRLLGARVDVTARKLAELRLEEERERLGVTLASIGDAVIATDRAGRITLMNPIARSLTGWAPEEALGRPLGEVFAIFSEKTGLPVRTPVEKVLETGRIVGLANHTVLAARDGTRRAIADSAAPIRDRGGVIVGVVLVFRDVTQEQRLERELAKASKLESIGVLAGGIAHDFNNILTSVAANVSLADRRLGPDHPAQPRLAAAQLACERAKDLTRQLLTFSRGGAPIRSATSVRGVVEEAVGFALQGSPVLAVHALPADLWAVDADAGQLGQVVHNIALNASQAMPGGGTLRVVGDNVTLDETGWVPLPPGRYVRLAFTDDGPGISAEDLPRVFDPFFTTKPSGNGLGLATAYSIVKRHGGHLLVDSAPGAGTTFTLILPATDAVPVEPPAPSPTAGGRGRVLVMDDDAAIRDLAAACLLELGYEPVCVPEGGEALRRYAEAHAAGRPFDVVMLDLTVPGGLGGRETVRRLHEAHPGARAIVSSGYSNDPVMASFRAHGFAGVLQKPFVVEDLARVLGEVVAGA